MRKWKILNVTLLQCDRLSESRVMLASNSAERESLRRSQCDISKIVLNRHAAH